MCQRLARTARPSNMAPRMTPSSTSVRLARTVRGSRKSGTPLAMASTPVSALQPAEKALRMSRNVTALSPTVGVWDFPNCVSLSPSGWMSPMAMMASSPKMNSMVGSRKARAVSPRPRRLSTMMKRRMPRQRGIVAPLRLGKADCKRGDARRDGDGHGQRVVHDERRGGHEAGVGTEVGPGDGVRSAAHRVGVDHLAVREHQDGQEDRRWRW